MAGINLSPSETAIYRIVQAIIQLTQGRSNAVGQVTLTPGVTTTVVDKLISPAATNVGKDSEIFLTPRTAHAGAALPTTFISAVNQGSFVLTHANSANTDVTYGWEARG
jgi:hypothetical protein